MIIKNGEAMYSIVTASPVAYAGQKPAGLRHIIFNRGQNRQNCVLKFQMGRRFARRAMTRHMG